MRILETDILILGYGAAGLTAAVSATRAGASVIVAEKQSEDNHTPNMRMSRGVLMANDDLEAANEYLRYCARGLIPDDVIEALALKSNKLISWINDVCPDLPYTQMGLAEHPEFPGSHAIKTYQGGTSSEKRSKDSLSGRDLYAHLRKAVIADKAQILWNSPSKRLIQENGRVVGALIDTPQGEVRVNARLGTILATGGFEYDNEAKLNYLPANPIYFYGNPGNTGDGLRMAQAVGADLWHMNQLVGRAIGNFPLPDGREMGFSLGIDAAAIGYEKDPAGYVIVNGEGERFANENVQALLTHDFFYSMLQFDPKTGNFPRIPSYWIFDEARRKAGPLSMKAIGANAVGLYDWSADNQAEIERGWIYKADTIEELAEKMGINNPKVTAETVRSYNVYCENDIADPLGRPQKSMIALDQGPFYGVRLFPGGSHTTGGPRRDKDARIVNSFGEPISGLWGAGELGQVIGQLYPADGYALCEALSFGQIAVESILAQRCRAAA